MGDYICILNPDTLVCDNTFDLLINYLKNNPAFKKDTKNYMEYILENKTNVSRAEIFKKFI